MLKEERYEAILELLENERYASAAALSRRLFVSLPTIRRDLAELSRRGLIVRNHGGAKKVSDGYFEVPLDFRTAQKISEKKQLCAEAVRLIGDNDIIFIDGSTTMLPIAELMSHLKSVTVITNGIPLALALNKHHVKTYCTGGALMESSLAYAGEYAVEFVRNFNIDIAFFSSHGVNEAGFIVDTSPGETMLRRAALKNVKKTVFLCDGEKFLLNAPYNLIPLTDVDCIITNTPVPASIRSAEQDVMIV